MIAPEQWTPSANLVLEPGAREAITIAQSAAVTAGPGAGKTELLAQRADFLLRTGTCPYPKRILAISFKRDAAAVLRQRVRQRSGNAMASRIDSLTFDAFAKRLIELFRPLLTGSDALDTGFRVGKERDGRSQVAFKELVPLALKIIDMEPRAVRFVRMTYTHVFLDEFQDCTDTQYDLIRKLFGGASPVLTAVGDEKQRIMGWAHALKGVFGRFIADFGAKPVALYQNHRSKPAIRRVQKKVARLIAPAAVDNIVIDGGGGKVVVAEFADEAREANAIAAAVERLIGKGVPAHEIAVLYVRDVDHLAVPVCEALDHRGIPWRNENELQDLSAEPVSQLMINLLRVLGDTPAPDAYAELMQALPDADDDAGLTDWMRFFSALRQRLAGADPMQRPAVLGDVLDAFLDRYSIANLAALATDYADTDFLNSRVAEARGHLVALAKSAGDIGQALRRFSAEGTVRIMTIHKCKGMEFDAVFIPAVEEEQWWGERDDECCAFFVAVSRARDVLAITHARGRSRPASWPGWRPWTSRRSPDEAFIDCARSDP
jgi:superfamily I DNA/RNA helicase